MKHHLTKSVVEGNLVFLSGMNGQDVETGAVSSNIFEEQMVVALDKIKVALEEAGSSMNNIVRTFILIKNLADYPRMRKTELEYYQKHAPLLVENPPASTFIVPASLARPELLVEIDVTAVISRDKPGWEVKFYPEYWGGKKLAYPYVAPEAPKFARSVVVGNLVFVSGCEALNPETVRTETNVFEEQMLICLDKVKMGLEEVGSSMSNIVKTHMLLPNLENYSSMRKIEVEYYKKHAPLLELEPPASTVIMPASLARPEFLIEIEAFGVISRDKPGWEVMVYPDYWGSKKFAYPDVAPGRPMAAKAAVVGNLVFVSGCQALYPTSVFEEQMAGALEYLKIALEGVGSSMDNIIKTHMLLTNAENYSGMRKAELEYYQKHAPLLVEQPPASTCFVVSSLDRPGFSIEIDAVAVVSGKTLMR